MELKTLRDIDEEGTIGCQPYNMNVACYHLLHEIKEEAKKHYDAIIHSFPDEKDMFVAQWIEQFFNLDDG